jgi:hypothetical protein
MWSRNCLPFRSTRVHTLVFSGVRVARSLVFCVVFCTSLFVIFLLGIVLSVLLQCTASDYPFGILWTLHCLFFFDVQLLITPLVSCGHCVVCPSMYSFWLPLWVSCGHYVVCPSSMYSSWLPLWHLQTFLIDLSRNKIQCTEIYETRNIFIVDYLLKLMYSETRLPT